MDFPLAGHFVHDHAFPLICGDMNLISDNEFPHSNTPQTRKEDPPKGCFLL